MSAMSPEVAAVRQEGLAAARDGVPRASGCPYAEGDWRRLDWLIGHASSWRRPTAKELKAANRARDRAHSRRKKAAARAARPAEKRPVRICQLGGCGNRLNGKQRNYCCLAHYARSGAAAESSKRARAVMAAKLRAYARSGAAAESSKQGRAVMAAKLRAQAARRAPPPPAADTSAPSGVARPEPVTPEMWRAACAHLDPVEMRRFMGFSEAQVARVVALQRHGGKAAA